MLLCSLRLLLPIVDLLLCYVLSIVWLFNIGIRFGHFPATLGFCNFFLVFVIVFVVFIVLVILIIFIVIVFIVICCSYDDLRLNTTCRILLRVFLLDGRDTRAEFVHLTTFLGRAIRL